MRISYRQFAQRWDKERWPNFSPKEFACRCCGESYWAPEYFDAAQGIRNDLGRSVRINCGHRCWRNNARVGGAPKSQHKKMAIDLSTRGMTEEEFAGMQAILERNGIGSIGVYLTFLHLDLRPGRFWIVGKGKRNAQHFRRIR